jgi:hypothetical protein
MNDNGKGSRVVTFTKAAEVFKCEPHTLAQLIEVGDYSRL